MSLTFIQTYFIKKYFPYLQTYFIKNIFITKSSKIKHRKYRKAPKFFTIKAINKIVITTLLQFMDLLRDFLYLSLFHSNKYKEIFEIQFLI